ncbi:MAG: hypothetical protein R6U17_01960 [Thermoplasmata archaeon]
MVLMITSSLYLPAYFKERGDFYTSVEYAQMYLDDGRYSELIIEYNYVLGFPPSEVARESLISIIYDVCEKDDVRDTIGDVFAPRPGRVRYDREDIESLLEEHFVHERQDPVMVLNVLYLDGVWNEKSNVLGLSFGGENIVMFKHTIRTVTEKSSNLEINDVETSVLIHEFGHLISLVGIGHGSRHEDEEYEHHCDESAGRCVMSSSVEIKVDDYSEPPPTEFCPLCLEEIEHIREAESGWGIGEYLTLILVAGQASIGAVWIAVCFSKDDDDEYDIYHQYYDDFEKDGH